MRLMLLACTLAVAVKASAQGVVKWKSSVTQAQCQEFHRSQGTTAKNCRYIPWSVINGPFSAEAYRASGLFDEVLQDKLYRINATPNDESYPLQWGMDKIQAPRAWDLYSTNGTVVLAVIDTGASYQHPDLINNLLPGYTSIGGRIKDGAQDDNGHGTHVAGIAGATGNNGIGVAGVNWSVKVLPIKSFNANGFGFSSDAVNAMEKLVELKRAGMNIRVVNNSWGSTGHDPFLQEAIGTLESEGIISVCAAGNEGMNIDQVFDSPAGLTNEGIVSVAASDQFDDIAFFSNQGLANVDLAAPGVDVYSTTFDGTYGYLSGTSMATPHVSGVLAMMFFANPSLTVKQAKDVLLDPQSLDRGVFQLNSTLGGRLNMYKALTARLFKPPVNAYPKISASTGLVGLPPKSSHTFTAAAQDANGDVLHYRSSSDSHVTPTGWLVDVVMGQVFSAQSSSSLTLSNKGIALDMAVNLSFSVADGRGGSDSKRSKAFAWRDSSLVTTLQPKFTAVPDPSGGVRWRVDGVPEGSLYAVSSHRSDGGALYGCCLTPRIDYVDGVAAPGVSVWRAHVMDPLGNFINSEAVQFNIGTSLTAPIAKPVFSTLRGPSPLRVTADFSASGKYLFGSSSGFFNIPLTTNPVINLTLTNLGANTVLFLVCDPDLNLMCDTYIQVFSVLPPGPRMTIERCDGYMVVNWTPSSTNDVFESSSDLKTWQQHSSGPPPVLIDSTQPKQFYRVRQ